MKNLLRISCPAFVLLMLCACAERTARTDIPKSYSKAGVAFEYPGNWEVTEDSQQTAFRYIFVETPGDAIVSIQIYSTEDAMEIEEFARSFSHLAKEQIPFGTIGASRFGSVEKSGGYEILEEHLSIEVLGEEVPHTRVYRRKPIDGRVCFIIEQVADEDRSKVIGGFEQVSSSFRYEPP